MAKSRKRTVRQDIGHGLRELARLHRSRKLVSLAVVGVERDGTIHKGLAVKGEIRSAVSLALQKMSLEVLGGPKWGK